LVAVDELGVAEDPAEAAADPWEQPAPHPESVPGWLAVFLEHGGP
jgi:hypothetical protein